MIQRFIFQIGLNDKNILTKALNAIGYNDAHRLNMGYNDVHLLIKALSDMKNFDRNKEYHVGFLCGDSVITVRRQIKDETVCISIKPNEDEKC